MSSSGSGLLSSRVAGLCLFCLACGYGLAASQIEYAFSSDPLGPRAFPLLLAAALALLSLIHVARPAGTVEELPRGTMLARSSGLVAIVLAVAFLMEPLGFFVSVLVLTVSVGVLFGARPLVALAGGGIQAALWYFVFAYLLDVYLPNGDLLEPLLG
jgi:putative tricarboxylic transport membrane protein